MWVDGKRFWLNRDMKEECEYKCSFVGKKKRSRSRSTMDDDDSGVWKQGKTSEAPSPCTECGKKFWSWKALFGHMRCHPERQWRGIIPPPNARRQQPPPPPPQQQQQFMSQEDHEVAACLLLLANANYKEKEKEEDVHQCSSCNKVFGSHQALGGHRASHKNVKGCFANANINNKGEFENENHENMVGSASDGHKCSICMRVFSTGQALGGHKRCHWEKGVVDNINPLLVDLNFPPLTTTDPHIDPPLSLDLRLGL